MNEFLESLTRREREIYEMRCAGRTSQSISKELNVSKRTIEVHVQNITDKATRSGLVWGRCMVKKPEVRT